MSWDLHQANSGPVGGGKTRDPGTGIPMAKRLVSIDYYDSDHRMIFSQKMNRRSWVMCTRFNDVVGETDDNKKFQFKTIDELDDNNIPIYGPDGLTADTLLAMTDYCDEFTRDEIKYDEANDSDGKGNGRISVPIGTDEIVNVIGKTREELIPREWERTFASGMDIYQLVNLWKLADYLNILPLMRLMVIELSIRFTKDETIQDFMKSINHTDPVSTRDLQEVRITYSESLFGPIGDFNKDEARKKIRTVI